MASGISQSPTFLASSRRLRGSGGLSANRLARQKFSVLFGTRKMRTPAQQRLPAVDTRVLSPSWLLVSGRRIQNATSGEIAFVQVKSSETQAVFDDYVSRFVERRERYDRMIFAVHTPRGNLRPPDGLPVQVAAGTAWLWARPSLQNQQLRRSQRSRKHGRKLTKH